MHVIILAKTKEEWALYNLLQSVNVPVSLSTSAEDALEKSTHVVYLDRQKESLVSSFIKEEKHFICLSAITKQSKKELLSFLGLWSETLYFTLWSIGDIDKTIAAIQKDNKGLIISLSSSQGTISCLIAAQKQEELQKAVSAIRALFAPWEFTSKEGSFSLALQERMLRSKKTLALGESCTGGCVAHLITQNSGSSGYFLGSFVTYAKSCKTAVLHVPESVLASFNVVSAEVASSMLDGVFSVCSADIGAAITGVAGPDGGSQENPVGTVWIAVGERGKEKHIKCYHLTGERQEIIQTAANLVLGALYTLGL